jgi:hypothetical protein
MKLLLYLCFFCGIVIDTFSQCSPSISLVGSSLSQTSDALLSSRAGLDYNSDLLIERAPGNLTININNADGCSNWQLSVSKTSIVWDATLKIWVNKTYDGTVSAPGASISPGGTTAYQEITSFSQSFFSGVKSRSSIQISYKISGISVLLPAKAYSTTVYYTISASL